MVSEEEGRRTETRSRESSIRKKSIRRRSRGSANKSSLSNRSVLDSVATASTSSITAATTEINLPDVYRYAQDHSWDMVASESDGFDFVHPNEGTTVLHLAVKSITGYDRTILNQQMKPEPKPMPMPTLELIEFILNKCPSSARIPCTTNTYTPLAYACLVVDDNTDLLTLEALIRLILRFCPDATKLSTSGGLSPLDIHIVSFSQLKNDQTYTANNNTNKDILASVITNEQQFTGRTDTNVLRTLLEHDSSLGEVRIVERNKVSGSLELLYRINATAFQELSKRVAKETQVLQKVSKWWVWRWIVILLKYGTKKKPGERFLAVSAATKVVGCPTPILKLAHSAFPHQILEPSYDDDQLLPLHRVCSWPCDLDCTSSNSMIPSRKSMAIQTLLQHYQQGAAIPNGNNELPLELALSTRTTWDLGVRKLCRAYPQALLKRSSETGLFPFMTAAVAAGETLRNQPPFPKSKRSLMSYLKNLARQDTHSVRTIYGLLRSNPDVLSDCFKSF